MSIRRRALAIVVAGAVTLSGLLPLAPLQAAVATVNIGPKPDWMKPVAGHTDGQRPDFDPGASSVSAPVEPTTTVPEVLPTAISLLPAAASVTTQGPDGATPATVAGEWLEVTAGVEVAATQTSSPADVPSTDPADPTSLVPTPAPTTPAAGSPVVDVGVLSESDAKAAGLSGTVVSLSIEGSEVETPVAVRLPESSGGGQFGADFEARQRWVQVDPSDPAVQVPVASVVDGSNVVLSPVVGSSRVLLTAVSSGTSSSGTGDFSATPLKSSAAWDVAEQTGAFTWSYDMTVPNPGVGPVPSLALAYNSQTVDGATGATNNQPSLVGEGWDLAGTGFIERSYTPCAIDTGATGAVAASGDLCWKSDNAVVAFAGHSGALVRDAVSGSWRLERDDGSRFEYLSGAPNCGNNGTASNDCWKMTTRDGTQYFFGKHQLPGWTPGKPTTRSVWTVPVYGNDPGEPCFTGTFANSSCSQAWRWNLDYVVDVNGNAQALYYTPETNKYAQNGSGAASYTRGGVLSNIEYGLRESNIFGQNAAGYRVTLSYDSKGRCSDAGGATCTTSSLDSALVPTTPSSYPDVPWDRLCVASACAPSQVSPSFFTNARLATVTAQVLRSGSYSTTDTWTLAHSFPSPGDGTNAALWLKQVDHAGSYAGQSAIAEPPTVFSGVTLQNRVWPESGLAPLSRYRLSAIKTSLGAVISINYKTGSCTGAQTPGILASPESNTNWCFPDWWQPPAPNPVKLDLFHKYPVDNVIVDPATGGAQSKLMTTQYLYGTPRWRYNDSPLTPDSRRTWNVFAGVDSVEVREGDQTSPSSLKVTQYTYYQGINGDRASAGGGAKSAVVLGTSIPDDRWLGGVLYRQRTLLGVGGAAVSESVETPWVSPPTANNGTLQSRLIGTSQKVVSEPVSTGGTRSVVTNTSYDSNTGLPLTVSTEPSDAISTCIQTSYAPPNTGAWIVGAVAEIRALDVSCANTSNAALPDHLVSQTRTTYDGLAWGAVPVKGLATATQTVDGWVSGAPTFAAPALTNYDALGRPVSVTNPLGQTSTQSYTPANSLPLTSKSTTNTAPFNWVTSEVYEPTTGTPIMVVDPNGATTTMAYDALSRLSKVWLPLRPQLLNPTSPSVSFSYALSQSAANAVTTRKYSAGGDITTYELYDGLARSVQTQSLSPAGGSVIKTTAYDQQGRGYWTQNPFWTTSVAPSGAYFVTNNDNTVPSTVVTSFDAIGRATKQSLKSLGALHSETVMAYIGADRVDTTPPQGGTASTSITNSLGQATALTQYMSGSVSGSSQTTAYQYDGAGRMTKMTDPAGNSWLWGFNLLGQRTNQSDPDSGVTTATYDALGNMLTTTDARGQTITTTYDALNRKTAQFVGSANGAKIAAWTYDTVKKGLVTSTLSYDGSTPTQLGRAYDTTVASYDAGGNVTESTVSVPVGAPAFGGTRYTTKFSYFSDSKLQTKSVPAAGGLAADTIRYGYDAWGGLTSIADSQLILGSVSLDPIGRVKVLNRQNSADALGYSQYTYDPATGATAGINDWVNWSASGQTVSDRTYLRDTAGNVTSQTITSTAPSIGTQRICYSYDGLRQLTRAWTPNASSTCATTPTSAAMGGIAPFWQDFAYDSATGNRTSITSHDSTGATTAASYSYPAGGLPRPHGVTQVTGAASLGAGAYSYDPAGNTTGRPGQAITFNEVGKVSQVVAGSETQRNIYDASGSVILSTSSTNGASLFLGDFTLTQAAGSAVISGYRTFYGPGGKPVAQRSGSTSTGAVVSWLFTGLDGTVDAQTVARTGVTTRVWRDPFGAPLIGMAAAWADSTGFLAKPTNRTTKLATIGARVYDSVIGKFLSVDPVVQPKVPQQNTGYAYAHNNPINLADPDGRSPIMLRDGGGVGSWKSPKNAVATPRSGNQLDLQHADSYSACGNRCQSLKTIEEWAPTLTWQGHTYRRSPDQTSYSYTKTNLLPNATNQFQAMNAFKDRASEIFPFEVVNCTLKTGGTCELHTGVPKNGAWWWVPFDGDTVMGVDTTPTSMTFTVLETDYFDGPSSTITFSTSMDDQGRVWLTQHAEAVYANQVVSLAVVTTRVSDWNWKLQAQRLDEVLAKHEYH